MLFKGNDKINDPYILSFETPLQYFLYFFDYNLLLHISEESTKFSIQKIFLNHNVLPTKEDTKKYLGICLILGLNPQPNIQTLWNNELSLVSDCMPLTQL